MQLDIELHDRPVVILGTLAAAHRVIRRYSTAGARVTAVIDDPLPPPLERIPGVRYAVQPEGEQLADWINLVGPAWLVVLVGVDPVTRDRIGRLCGHLRIVLASETPAANRGTITLVGGGPGITRLLTLQACEALLDADVVFFDRLAPTEDLRRLAPAAELVDVGKDPHHHPVSQTEIETQMIARARLGASVVRLKGGDPFVFGRGAEEMLAGVLAGLPVTVVPGVSSALSVPAAAGIPVTSRGISHTFTVISGHDPLSEEELSGLSQLNGTLVIMMAVHNLAQIIAGLLRAGLAAETPAAVVERGFSPTQRTTVAPICELADEARRIDVQSPAVVVIGEVVRLAGRFDSTPWQGILDPSATVAGGQGTP
jgi:uroporphyrin-III C-methyltransferase